MIVWKLSADANNYDNLTLINKNDWKQFRQYTFDGRSLIDLWEPMAVRVIEKIKNSDTPSLSPGVPVFSERSLQILGEMVNPFAEILQLRSRYGMYFIANVTNVLNCIDYENSVYDRFPSSGRIMDFQKYVFLPEAIHGQHFFKIIDQPRSRVFVSDVFKKIVDESDLEGFLFEKVWESE